MAEKSNITTVEHEGYKFDVDLDLFDDVEFFELADGVEQKQSNLIEILKLVLKDKYSDMADYFKKKDGRFKMSTASAILDKILSVPDPKE